MVTPIPNFERIEQIALELPESIRVDDEAWDNLPTFRVRKKNYVFAKPHGEGITIKLSKDEAFAVIASDDAAEPMGFGLGDHGWVYVGLADNESEDRWEEITEWIRTSYILVAPKKLAEIVINEDFGESEATP
ncbi:MAG: MmcQ/YjbR family DNA-binding protein [Acidimicrobiales bacterium]